MASARANIIGGWIGGVIGGNAWLGTLAFELFRRGAIAHGWMILAVMGLSLLAAFGLYRLAAASILSPYAVTVGYCGCIVLVSTVVAWYLWHTGDSVRLDLSDRKLLLMIVIPLAITLNVAFIMRSRADQMQKAWATGQA